MALRIDAQELRSYLVGWKGYFRLANTRKVFRTLDEWICHRLRAIQLKQWRREERVPANPGRCVFGRRAEP